MACRAEAAGEGWWEALVMLQFVTSDFVLRHPIYGRAIGSLPGNLIGLPSRSSQQEILPGPPSFLNDRNFGAAAFALASL